MVLSCPASPSAAHRLWAHVRTKSEEKALVNWTRKEGVGFLVETEKDDSYRGHVGKTCSLASTGGVLLNCPFQQEG